MAGTIAELLTAAGAPGSEARRDAEVLLGHVLERPRSYLFAWPERALPEEQALSFAGLWQRRTAGEPVAYLTGEREFWSLPLRVSRDTLIPRPETELLVEQALALSLPGSARVVDLGTGSGAIAIALASERPTWEIDAVEASAAALAVARANGARHKVAVRFSQGSWFEPLQGQYDLLVSNPPYLAADDPHLGEGDLRFEPQAALVAEGGALCAIDAILAQAPAYLAVGGWLLLEHGCEQGAAVRERLRRAGLGEVVTWRDAAGLERVSGGQWSELW